MYHIVKTTLQSNRLLITFYSLYWTRLIWWPCKFSGSQGLILMVVNVTSDLDTLYRSMLHLTLTLYRSMLHLTLTHYRSMLHLTLTHTTGQYYIWPWHILQVNVTYDLDTPNMSKVYLTLTHLTCQSYTWPWHSLQVMLHLTSTHLICQCYTWPRHTLYVNATHTMTSYRSCYTWPTCQWYIWPWHTTGQCYILPWIFFSSVHFIFIAHLPHLTPKHLFIFLWEGGGVIFCPFLGGVNLFSICVCQNMPMSPLTIKGWCRTYRSL